MEQTIYIDVVFLISWGMQGTLLWAAGRMAGFSAERKRIMAGGFLSAVLYTGYLCFFREMGGLILSVLLLSLGLGIAYYPKQPRNWLRLWGSAWAVSFLMGGGMQVLFSLTQAQRFLGQGMMVQKAYPWWLLPWASGMAYVLLKMSARWLQANIQRRTEYCTAKILWHGKGVEGRMLIDTGNGLTEGGRGVAVVEISTLLPLFSGKQQVSILSGDMRGLDWMGYTSLGNPDGRLWGIRGEKLILQFGEKEIVHENIFIGINMEAFAGAYEGLVPPCLLEEE